MSDEIEEMIDHERIVRTELLSKLMEQEDCAGYRSVDFLLYMNRSGKLVGCEIPREPIRQAFIAGGSERLRQERDVKVQKSRDFLRQELELSSASQISSRQTALESVMPADRTPSDENPSPNP
ncbi:MAG: hypothetical protein KDN05_06305 [Verrucomicrobiae bacterium]|nr:hypothetical protein [Verrucomicrobiae bacterium]